MKKFLLLAILWANINLNAQKMDSISRMKLIDSFRLCSNKMFVRMDSVKTRGNGKNVNSVIVSRKELDSIILRLTDVVKNKVFDDISKEEHIEIIRFLNWFEVKDKDEQPCKNLIDLIDNSFYYWKLLCKFHWTYSPGMGWHIIELEAELAGKSRTCFEIKD